MAQVLAIMSVIVVLGILGLLLHNLYTRRYDVLSWRNIFLLGFMHFFGIGSYYTAIYGVGMYAAGSKGFTTLILALPSFALVFLIGAKLGARWKALERVMPTVELPITSPGLLISIVVLTSVGLLGSMIPMSGYISVLVVQFKGGLTAAATGLATYYLIAKRRNPIAWLVFFGTVGMALVIGTVGSIERRSTLGVIMAIGWMWWYFSLRGGAAATTILRLSGLAAVGVVVLLAYAGIRFSTFGGSARDGSGFGIQHRANQISELIKNPTIGKGSVDNFLYSDTPPITMFVIENYPDPYKYMPFQGAWYLITNPIPRRLFVSKPEPMATIVQDQLRAQANLGIGIIGHGWAEGGWLGVLGYAGFFGIVCGAVDALIRRRAWNPYFIAAIGSCLGQLVAIPRGECSLFFLLVIAGFIGAVVVLYSARLFAGAVMAAAPLTLTPLNAWIGVQSEEGESKHGDESWSPEFPEGLPLAYEAY